MSEGSVQWVPVCVPSVGGHSIAALMAHYDLSIALVDSAIRQYFSRSDIHRPASLTLYFMSRRQGARTTRSSLR